MSASRLLFSRVVDTLAHFYGEPSAPRITDPFAMVVWENIAYLANDARRAEAFEELRKKVGLRPSDIRKASDKDLLSVTSKGIVPEISLEKLRDAAEITRKFFGDDLCSVLKKPIPAAKRDLRKSIGEPAAQKILLFNHKLPVLALDSSGLRVLVRLGFAPEKKNYSATYKGVQRRLRRNCPPTATHLFAPISSCGSTVKSCASEANPFARVVLSGRSARSLPRWRHSRRTHINMVRLKMLRRDLVLRGKNMVQHRGRVLLAKSAAMQTLSMYVLGLLLTLWLAATLSAQEQPNSGGSWKFAVSGDSRNCGDIVMPAIAQGVRRDGASFYWHLGDYRLMSNFDEDYRRINPNATIDDYLSNAWPDFIQHQMKPFGDLPVFLEIGNHELITPKTRPLYIAQFADWLDQPVLRRQRLADNPDDHLVKTYHHWIERGVDFIGMDNASADMFDANQMSWFQSVLAKDGKDPSIHTVVLGMHAALPDGLSAGHSMNDSAQEASSGRIVYSQLVAFRRSTKKNVYVLASHSHFVLNNVYATACHPQDEVLTGWIMGSAGAVWYLLPLDHAAADVAMTDVYGYLLATVAPDGTITFDFKQVKEPDVPASVVKEFSQPQVDWCFAHNTSTYLPAGPKCGKGASSSGQ